MITCLVLKFQLDISKHSGDMEDFASNTLQTNLCSFILKLIGD